MCARRVKNLELIPKQAKVPWGDQVVLVPTSVFVYLATVSLEFRGSFSQICFSGSKVQWLRKYSALIITHCKTS